MKAVNIAVASRTLFQLDMDFDPENKDSKNMEEYLAETIDNEDVPFEPGPAFTFISVSLFVLTLKPGMFTFYGILIGATLNHIILALVARHSQAAVRIL